MLAGVGEEKVVTRRSLSGVFRSLILRYGTATLVVALVLCLKFSLNPVFGRDKPFRFFILVVMAASWFGGRRVGIFTSLLIAVGYFVFLSPGNPWVINSDEAIRAGLFLMEAVAICWLTASFSLALDRARHSEQRYRLLADNIPQLIWMARADGSTEYRNQRYYSYTGVRPEEMVGLKWQEQIHPEDLASHVQRWTDAQRSGQPFDTQCRIRGNDGVYRWFLCRSIPVHDSTGKIVRWFGTATDIDREKRAEGEVRRSEALFHSIADNAPVMIWMTDARGQRTFCNKFYLGFTGRTMAQEWGKGWTDQIHADDHSTCLQVFQEAFTKRQDYRMEFRLGRADGQFRWVLETGVPHFDSERVFLGYIGTCVDISDRKWSEQVLRGAYDELEDQVAETSVELAESNESLRAEAAKRKAAEETLQKWGLK